MSKYFLKESGKEVKIGDTIEVEKEVRTPLGRGNLIVDVVITEDNIPLLTKEGIIKVLNEPAIFKTYVERIPKSHDMDSMCTAYFMSVLLGSDKFVALCLLLKAASDIAMENYTGVECAIINLHNGYIYKYSDKKNALPTMPVFPTIEDAEATKAVLKELFIKVYGNNKQENKEC